MRNLAFNVERLKRLDEAEWTKLYEQIADYIFTYAFRRVNNDKEAALDVTQQVFIAALTAIDRFEDDGSRLVLWLTGIARNTVHTFLRKESRFAHHENLPDPMDSQISPQERLIQLERQELVGTALSTLPQRWEDVLRWRYCDDLPLKEIGDRLGLSATSAESLVRRAKKGLSKAFLKTLASSKEPLKIIEELG